jgi:hypothetical protein
MSETRLQRIVRYETEIITDACMYLEVLACGHRSAFGHRNLPTVVRLIAAGRRRVCGACQALQARVTSLEDQLGL